MQKETDKKTILPEGITEEELNARVNAAYAEAHVGTTKKQRKRLAGTIISVVLELLVVAVLIVSVSSAASGNAVWIFGHSMSIVATDSMTGEIEVGEMIFVRSCDIEEFKIGDNVVFTAGRSFGYSQMVGRSIVHKVEEIKVVNGETRLYTRGVKSGAVRDGGYVTADPDDDFNNRLVGMQVGKSAFLGAIYSFLSNPVNWFFIAATLGIVWFSVRQIKKVLRAAKSKSDVSGSDGDKKSDEFDGETATVRAAENPPSAADEQTSSTVSGDKSEPSEPRD